MMNNQNHYKKMTETPVSKLILELGAPTTVSMLVTSIYNIADTYYVGRLGTSASGAVGVVFGLMAIIQAIGFMFGHGGGSILSRKLGTKEYKEASVLASTSFACAIIIGIFLTVGGLIFIEPLMKLLGSTETILPYAKTYAVYVLIAAPIMTASFVLNNILRYEGLALFAMIGITVGAVLNIFGDWFFMVKLGMGIEGAGLATALSQCVSFLVLLSVFILKKTQCRLLLKNVSCNIERIILIIKTGFPSFIRQGLGSVATMFLNKKAGLYGDAAVSAMTIVNRICFLIFSVGLGICQGFQPVSAFNYGAGKYNRVRKGYYFTFIMGELFLVFISVICMFFAPELVSKFIDNPAVIDSAKVIEIGVSALKIQLVGLFFQPLVISSSLMFQSIGKSGAATFLSMLRSGICFLPLIVVLPNIIGLEGVKISQTIADVLAFIITIPLIISFLRKLPREDEVSMKV